MPDDFVFFRQSRNWPTLLAVIGVWSALFVAWAFLDAAWWILAVVALFTLPALYDLWANPQINLQLTDQNLRWSLPRAEADISLHEIDYVRLDTRLDFTVRATVVLKSGRKLRIPFPATPPHQAFEAALNARDIPTQRHHFSLMQ